MPKECIDCRFITVDDQAAHCDRCGGERLRFSMLAGMKFQERKSEAAKAKLGDDDRPRPLDRVKQSFIYVVASQIAAFILFGAAVYSTPDDEVSKKKSFSAMLETICEVYPVKTFVGATLIPAAAAAGGVVFALRGVYLAQQMGLILAPVSALISLAAFDAIGGAAPILAWLLSPVFAAGLAFVAGLRMTGFVRTTEAELKTIEYKPVDSWNREAKPKFVDLRLSKSGYYRRLIIGVGVGGATSNLLPLLLAVMSGAAPNEMMTAAAIFGWTGVLAAGAFAGAGTTSPLIQGALAGATMYFVRHYAHLFVFTPETAFQGFLHVAAGAIGGIAGRTAFPPPRVVRGRQRCASDGVVYVGDELVKNSA